MKNKAIYQKQPRKTEPTIPESLLFIGKQMEKIRFNKGLNQVEINRLCIKNSTSYRITPNALCQYENGMRIPTMQALSTFIQIMGITWSQFFEGV